MSSSSPSGSLPLRRNGKPQSCEPCRKAKAACDHVLPKCGRCTLRGIGPQCTYQSLIGKGKAGSQQSVHAARVERNHGASSKLSRSLLLLVSQRSKSREELASTEFIGPTSYAAVFRENQISIGEDLWNTGQEEESPGESLLRQLPSSSNEDDLWKSSERLNLGIGILMNFPDRRLSLHFLERNFKLCDQVLHEPTMRYCYESMWSTYGDFLIDPRQPELLSAMAEKLFSNGSMPLPPCRSTKEWLESFTGERLRWELIGTLFALFGLSIMTLSDWDPLFTSDEGHTEDRESYARKMGECADACLVLCDDGGAVNEFVIWLMLHNLVLHSFYNGDTSHILWKRHGALASAITSLGLHRGSDTTNSPSFMVSELRKSVFQAVFLTDKQLATFTGRPPTLSRRYCNCQMPLDLTDDELMVEGEELAGIVSKLDADGWSTSGKVSRTTIERAWTLMSLIRDEILELSLGPSTQSPSSRRNEMKQRSQEAYSRIPLGLRYRPEEMSLIKEPFMFSLRIMLSLEFLLNKFLLERLPDATSGQDRQDLLDTAKQMLDRVLVLSENRDRLADFTVGFAWAIAYTGIPSAGVLAIELLKQSKYPHGYPLKFPRSEVIQNLSIFIGFLNWVRPTAGNYTLCVRMRKVIKRILDQVLEPAIALNPALEAYSAAAQQVLPEIDMSSVMDPTDDPEFLQWLNSVDWTRGPWVDGF